MLYLMLTRFLRRISPVFVELKFWIVFRACFLFSALDLKTWNMTKKCKVGRKKRIFLFFFLDLAVIIGFFVLLWNLALSNIIPFWGVAIVVIIFVCAIPLRITARFLGGTFGELVRLAFTVGMPVLSLFFPGGKVWLRGY